MPKLVECAEKQPSLRRPMPEESDVEVRFPSGNEWVACRMLLPEAFRPGVPPEAWIAIDHQARRIAGAAVHYCAGRKITDTRIHVVPEYRRKGIGSRLLQRLCRHATESGFDQVCVSTDTKHEPDAEPFLVVNGFSRSTRIYGVEGDLLVVRDCLNRIRDRLIRTGRIPAVAKFVNLDEAPRDQVAKMYAAHIAAASDFHPGYVLPLLSDKRVAGSSVFMVNGTVQGLLLCEINADKNSATVHARVVAPGYRGSSVNCLLMLRSLELAVSAGARRVRFDAPEKNSDTLKLVKRCNGEITRILDWFVRDLRHTESQPPDR